MIHTYWINHSNITLLTPKCYRYLSYTVQCTGKLKTALVSQTYIFFPSFIVLFVNYFAEFIHSLLDFEKKILLYEIKNKSAGLNYV